MGLMGSGIERSPILKINVGQLLRKPNTDETGKIQPRGSEKIKNAGEKKVETPSRM